MATYQGTPALTWTQLKASAVAVTVPAMLKFRRPAHGDDETLGVGARRMAVVDDEINGLTLGRM